jgi:ATP-dependent RNA helicase RhlE
MNSFKKFGLNEQLIEGIDSLGFQTPTPVQDSAIPMVLAGKDIIVSAQTGTGKTGAFLIPVINKIMNSPATGHHRVLILVPTRELALQIDQFMEGLSYFTPISSIAVYGGGDGMSFSQEKAAFENKTDMIICTPGRMIAHINMGYVDLKHIEYLILDEADRMLDIGFYDDIMKIIGYLPTKRQTLMFSATMPSKIRTLAQRILHKPEEVSIAISKPNENIEQKAYVVYDAQKVPLVKEILSEKVYNRVLIFCSTKESTKVLARELKRARMMVEDIHSDLEQQEREQVVMDFKSEKLKILVATDLLSRGIDIEDIELVINYDVPGSGEDYIHRIGRTARAASTGVAITLINERDQRRFGQIEELLGRTVPKSPLPGSLGEGPVYDPAKKVKSGGRPQGNFRKKGPGGHQRRK